jgi:hypothetical protein
MTGIAKGNNDVGTDEITGSPGNLQEGWLVLRFADGSRKRARLLAKAVDADEANRLVEEFRRQGHPTARLLTQKEHDNIRANRPESTNRLGLGKDIKQLWSADRLMLHGNKALAYDVHDPYVYTSWEDKTNKAGALVIEDAPENLP